MSAIYSRPGSSNLWIRYSHRGAQYRESCGSADEAIARSLLKHRLAELGADSLGLRKFVGPTMERLTMDELFNELEADFSLRQKLEADFSLRQIKSLKPSLSHLRAARREFGQYRVVEITPMLIDQWYQTQLKGDKNEQQGNSVVSRKLQQRERLAPLGDRPTTSGSKRPDQSSTSDTPSQRYHPHALSPPRPATLNRVVSMVSQALTLGFQRQLVAFTPILRKLSESGNARQGFLNPADFRALVAQLPGHLQDFVCFAYLSGWRKGALQSSTWPDVDLVARTIRLRPEHDKAGTGNVLALEGELWEIIARRLAARAYQTFQKPHANPHTSDSDMVYREPTSTSLACAHNEPPATVKDAKLSRSLDRVSSFIFHLQGRPIGDFRKAWVAALRRVGLPDTITFHDLRRSAVRNLRLAGVNPDVIMRMVGHKTQAMLTRYNITDLQDQREAQQRLESYLAAQNSQIALLRQRGGKP